MCTLSSLQPGQPCASCAALEHSQNLQRTAASARARVSAARDQDRTTFPGGWGTNPQHVGRLELLERLLASSRVLKQQMEANGALRNEVQKQAAMLERCNESLRKYAAMDASRSELVQLLDAAERDGGCLVSDRG